MHKKGFVTGKMAPTEITRRDGEEKKEMAEKYFLYFAKKDRRFKPSVLILF